MSEQSSPQNNQSRNLSENEKKLLFALLYPGRGNLEKELDNAVIEDMKDGGMGSIRFLTQNGEVKSLGGIIAEAEYIDEDETPVSIIVMSDKKGGLYEVDFWKVDFSPLKQYPRPDQLRIKV